MFKDKSVPINRDSTADILIIGAGIVGMTVAYHLKQRNPALSILILEKESQVGVHASGRNSGVLHCGIYYGSDTLKAKVCARGAARMMDFAQEHQLPWLKSGKVILATREAQLPTVDKLMRNAAANGISAYLLTEQELRAREPHAAKGTAAIYCPDTAVIDSQAVVKKLQSLLEAQGVRFKFDCLVKGLKAEGQLLTTKELFSYGFLYNCAGAHADQIARHFGLAENYVLVPFKGIYWKLSESANALLRSNIYPVPDVTKPFLGVHLTRVMSGDVYVGPTAIPVLGRENYHGLQGVHVQELWSICKQLASMYLGNQNHFRSLAHAEMAKYSKRVFLKAARQLLPALKAEDFVPTSKAGIRPQLVNLKSKQLEMDYIFERTETSMHVLNAISPAFTSSFAFAEMIVDESGY